MTFTTHKSRQGNEKSVSAPYVAFKTFKNFIRSLSVNGLPSHIDKSVMSGMSGGVQSHLSSTLRFLGLVNEDLSPTSLLESLVDCCGSESWQETLAALIQASYLDILAGVDLEKATPDQLDKCFNCSAVMILSLIHI